MQSSPHPHYVSTQVLRIIKSTTVCNHSNSNHCYRHKTHARTTSEPFLFLFSSFSLSFSSSSPLSQAAFPVPLSSSCPSLVSSRVLAQLKASYLKWKRHSVSNFFRRISHSKVFRMEETLTTITSAPKWKHLSEPCQSVLMRLHFLNFMEHLPYSAKFSRCTIFADSVNGSIYNCKNCATQNRWTGP